MLCACTFSKKILIADDEEHKRAERVRYIFRVRVIEKDKKRDT
jgi:hypothetical protein